MAEETLEQKLARYEFVLDAYVRELTKLREENELLRSAAGAHEVLKSIYADANQPIGQRVKAATAALGVEKPRLTPVPPAIDVTAEEIIPLPELVAQRRARADKMLLEPPFSNLPKVFPRGDGNGSDDDTGS